MTVDAHPKLNGFSAEKLSQFLKIVENDHRFSYYADVIRAYLSTDSEAIANYQRDERTQVAIAACCNPKADLEFISTNFKKFALVATLNPSIHSKIAAKILKYEHGALPAFIAANEKAEDELKVFSALVHDQISQVTGEDVDSWFAESLDNYEESSNQSLAEILQLLCLESLGFFDKCGEGDYSFWQMLEDSEIEPKDKFWKALGNLPRIPAEIYNGGEVAVNNHISRELAAEKALPGELLTELSQDDTALNFDSDNWFCSRSPRASVAFSIYTPSKLLSKIITDEIEKIQSNSDYFDGSFDILWRVAGNESLNDSHLTQIYEFLMSNVARCSNQYFYYDVISMLQGGNYVDAPLMENSAFPESFLSKFNNVIKLIEGAKS
jgi:hypothetical protein